MSERLRIEQVIVVEGRYDASALAPLVDALILTTDGFAIYKDKQTQALLKELGRKRGIILLTDSDGAGFVIRNFLKGAIPKDQLKQAYIPDIYGKERRKAAPGKEGKLGVEGMSPQVLLTALERAGATFEDGQPPEERAEPITKADLYGLGLTGGQDSQARRQALLKKLGLPEHMTANAMLEALNILYTRAEFLSAMGE